MPMFFLIYNVLFINICHISSYALKSQTTFF